MFTPGKDKKEIFLGGFSGASHDHTLHSVTAGPDGEFYFNTGNVGPFRVKGSDGRYFTSQRGVKSTDGHFYAQGATFPHET